MAMKDPGPFAIRVWKFDHWAYVGPHYGTREIARGWVPFVRKAWHGMKTCVVSRQRVEREKKREAKGV